MAILGGFVRILFLLLFSLFLYSFVVFGVGNKNSTTSLEIQNEIAELAKLFENSSPNSLSFEISDGVRGAFFVLKGKARIALKPKFYAAGESIGSCTLVGKSINGKYTLKASRKSRDAILKAFNGGVDAPRKINRIVTKKRAAEAQALPAAKVRKQASSTTLHPVPSHSKIYTISTEGIFLEDLKENYLKIHETEEGRFCALMSDAVRFYFGHNNSISFCTTSALKDFTLVGSNIYCVRDDGILLQFCTSSPPGNKIYQPLSELPSMIAVIAGLQSSTFFALGKENLYLVNQNADNKVSAQVICKLDEQFRNFVYYVSNVLGQNFILAHSNGTTLKHLIGNPFTNEFEMTDFGDFSFVDIRGMAFNFATRELFIVDAGLKSLIILDLGGQLIQKIDFPTTPVDLTIKNDGAIDVLSLSY
jgi:hypothetical protein